MPGARSLALAVVVAGGLWQCSPAGHTPGNETVIRSDTGQVDAASSDPITMTYAEETRAFANPERGFYHGRGRTQEQPPSNSWPGLNKTAVPTWRDTEHVRVVTQYYHLDPYKESDIPAEYIAIVEDDLNFVRAEGMKIVPRFTYSWDRASVPAGQLNDTTAYWTHRHIDTLIPVLARHADIIAFVEMGFVGLWGEFWGSDNDWTTDPPDYGACSTVQHYVDVFPDRQAARAALIQRVLNLLPQQVKLTLRYPRDKRAMFRDDATGTDSLPLSAAEAHTGMPKARVGFHNDSVFTGGEDEQNTFFRCSDSAFVEAQIDWQSQDALYVPQGGETGCPYDPAYGECTVAKRRLEQRRFDVLNARFCPETVQAWRDGGCFDEIAARLGYRIRLTSAALVAAALRPGGTFELSLEIVNDGYGKIYNERDFEIVARNQATGGEYFLQAEGQDPRFWLPGAAHQVHVTGGIPVGMPEGTYDVLAFLPDPAPALRNARVTNRSGDAAIPQWSAYSIRLANQGVWDESTGYNDLGFDLTISGSAAGLDYVGTNWFVNGPAGQQNAR